MLTFNVKAGDFVGLFGIFFEWYKSGDAHKRAAGCDAAGTADRPAGDKHQNLKRKNELGVSFLCDI
jgi:hypothetical protein